MEFAPRAVQTNRGVHPDIDPETGELRDDVHFDQQRRDFYRMARDPERWQHFYGQLTREQSQLPEWIQQQVGGQTYGDDVYEGYRLYRAELARLRAAVPGEVTGRDIERMSLSEYDALFDEKGQPRKGTEYVPLASRDVDLNAEVDPYSARELRRRQP